MPRVSGSGHAFTVPIALGVLIVSLLQTDSLAAVRPAVGAVKPPTATFGLGPSGVSKLDGRPSFNYVVSPGAQLQDHVAVVNLSARRQTFGLYVTDASNASDGSFTYPVASIAPTDAGRWMSVQTEGHTDRVTIPARSTQIFPIVVAVPRAASPGDHAAAVIVSLTARSTGAAGARVDLDQRIAIRTLFRVSGPLHPGLRVESLRASFRHGGLVSGSAVVSYRIRNSGNVKLGGRQRVRVAGVLSGSTQQGLAVPVLLPGGVVEMRTKIGHVLPQLQMTATVTVTPLQVAGDADPARSDVIASVRFWAFPWVWLLALLVLLALLFIGRRRHRRRRLAGASAQDRPVGNTARQHDLATRLAALAVMTVPSVVGAAPGAHATDRLPYTDHAVTGSIGLCDVKGHNVTSGKITDKPFVWLAVGTTAAPAPYDEPGRTAFLTAFQPRRGVAPGDWSGTLLAAASRYSNPAHPMSQATPISSMLTNFLGRYPPEWDGLVQLRLLLGGSNRSVQTDTYDATDLRVSGDTWRVVRGGNGPCNAGSAVNSAVLLHVAGATGLPGPGAMSSPPSVVSRPVPQQTRGVDTTPRTSTSATRGASRSSTPLPAHQADGLRQPGHAKTAVTVLAVGGGVAVVVATLLTVWCIRRRTTP